MADTAEISFSQGGAIRLTLSGKLAHLPSTSNVLKGKPTAKGIDAIQRLRLLTELTKNQILLLSTCIKLPIHDATVLAVFAPKPGRWDSHNQPKPLGDWLEKVGLIDDDSKIEILCFKSAEYPELGDIPNTIIDIYPRALVRQTTLDYISTLWLSPSQNGSSLQMTRSILTSVQNKP